LEAEFSRGGAKDAKNSVRGNIGPRTIRSLFSGNGADVAELVQESENVERSLTQLSASIAQFSASSRLRVKKWNLQQMRRRSAACA